MNTALYMCLGGGIYVEQTIYSIYSAFRFLAPQTPGFQIILYTDTPERFGDLPVKIEALSKEQLDRWQPNYQFVGLCKIEAVKAALLEHRGNVVYVDSDTYFEKSPLKLFERIGPGRTAMHKTEMSLLDLRLHDELAKVVASDEYRTPSGEPWKLSPYEMVWNSGIIGINEADAPLLDEALTLTDAFYPRSQSWIAEQHAITVAFGRETKRSETFDIVHHYWYGPTRRAFNEILPKILAATAGLPPAERAAKLWPDRPIEPLRFRLRSLLKREVLRMGFFPQGRRKLPV